MNQPVDIDGLARRAVALMSASRDGEAVAVFAELARLKPQQVSHWVNLGTVLRRLKRYDEALAAYIEAAARGEASASFLYNVGLLHHDRGDYESARRVLADAVGKAPRDAEIRLQYAQCCYDSLHIESAIGALSDWRQLQPLTTGQQASLALLLLNLGEAKAAAEATEQASREATADPQPAALTLLRLAQIQERSNRIAAAEALLLRLDGLLGADAADREQGQEQAKDLGPDLALLRAQINLRRRRYEQAGEQFRQLAAACAEPHRRHLYLFPLAKALDARRQYAEAWQCLRDAHEAQQLHLARTNPEAAGLREAPLLITRFGCNSEDIRSWDEADAPPAEASPVFIVAFPRSGTTLLEQMLDAHPALVSMDEQPYLQQAIDRITDLGIDYPAGLAALTAAQLAEAREHYWSLTRRKVQLSGGQRLIDKNPLNLLRLPAIRRLFPHARILLAIRHPCDVVLSCYMQHFRAPEFALLCRDLPTLARGFQRSFDFWYEQLPLLQPAVREIRYETFVADFAAQSRGIMDFLGLDLVNAQLEPAAHALAKGFISTPSYAQVIEPVHRRAVGRWQPYAPYFGDALASLRPSLDRWGYSA